MSNGTQITVHFCCPCGMHYTATQEQRPEQSSGSFGCQDCEKPVHEWEGNFDYFDWQTMVMQPVHAYGKSPPTRQRLRAGQAKDSLAPISPHIAGKNWKAYQ